MPEVAATRGVRMKRAARRESAHIARPGGEEGKIRTREKEESLTGFYKNREGGGPRARGGDSGETR